MKTQGVKRLAENLLTFAERIDFPVACCGGDHSDALQSIAFAVKGLADIVQEQQLIINSLTKEDN